MEKIENGKKIKLAIIAGSIIVSLLIVTILFSKLANTVQSGTYHIKQAAITGTMSAIMKPGMYALLFGGWASWPTGETYYFTADRDTVSDVDTDMSIEVRFNDGSLAKISGTIRIIMPTLEEDAINLVTKLGYRTYASLKDKLILPVLRNAIRNSANLMSSRESYSTLRSDFVNWSWDQIQNGVYQTEEEIRETVDEISGKKIRKTFKVIKKDKSGNIVRTKDPLDGTNIKLANFEVKQFRYSRAVTKQIETQQVAYMAVATAMAMAKQAEQEKLRVIAEGRTKVEEARFSEEQEKVRAVTNAQKEKEVGELRANKEKNIAEIAANQRKNVSKLDRDSAEFKKQEEILLGEGEAKRKRLIMQADGALKQKLDAWLQAQRAWAVAFEKRSVPSYVNYGGSSKQGQGTDFQTQQFQSFLNIMMAKQIGLDMKVGK